MTTKSEYPLPSDIIKPHYVAYHVGINGKIDDMMTNLRGAYTGKTIQAIINDGWSFVIRSKKYKKGQKAPDFPTQREPILKVLPPYPLDDYLRCPHCAGKLKITLSHNTRILPVEKAT